MGTLIPTTLPYYLSIDVRDLVSDLVGDLVVGRSRHTFPRSRLFLRAPSGTSFLGAPSGTPFLGAPSGTLFLGAPLV
jgi:hypothetical protein